VTDGLKLSLPANIAFALKFHFHQLIADSFKKKEVHPQAGRRWAPCPWSYLLPAFFTTCEERNYLSAALKKSSSL